MKLKANLFYAADCILGESPLWDALNNCWFWVDIDGKKIYRCGSGGGSIEIHSFSEKVSLVVHGHIGELILGTENGISRYHPKERRLVPISDLNAGWHNMRCNDGICDSKGRLWIGTMDNDHKAGAGKLYCVEKNKISACIENFSIPNGMAWSIDNKRLYYTDSPTGNIVSYLYDNETGEIKFEKAAVKIPERMGMPDGMAMDERGILWVAIWGGYMVAGYDVQKGKLVSKIALDVPNVTSCAFGGEDMDQLIITTAHSFTDLKRRDKHSGDVFIANMPVRGMPAYRCTL